MSKTIKIGYFADGPWSHNAFDLLNSDSTTNISFVCARFDTNDEKLKQLAETNNIPFIKHKNINSQEFIEQVQEYGCDIFVSMSFNQIFKKEIINLPPLKTINCHAGKLPFYRGRNILNWALINDEKEFGITVHYVDEGIDTGDIILQECFPITDKDDYASLLQVSHTACADILYKSIKKIQSGDFKPQPQQEVHPVGFYCSMRGAGDEIIHWDHSTRDLFNFIRALSKPGPMAVCQLNGQDFKVNQAKIIENSPSYKCIPGAILQKTEKGLLVKTGDSSILLTEYEHSGKIRVGDRLL